MVKQHADLQKKRLSFKKHTGMRSISEVESHGCGIVWDHVGPVSSSNKMDYDDPRDLD